MENTQLHKLYSIIIIITILPIPKNQITWIIYLKFFKWYILMIVIKKEFTRGAPNL